MSEAFAIAAEHWPRYGTPPNPGGWILTTARNRAIDRLRRESSRADRTLTANRMFGDDMKPEHNPELDELDAFVDVVADDQLRLIFLCCHPALAADSQVALTLRLLSGLQTGEIARAFLVPEATMGQRITRAKRKLRDNHVSYRIPRAAQLPGRLNAALDDRIPDLQRRPHGHLRRHPDTRRSILRSHPARAGPRRTDARRG